MWWSKSRENINKTSAIISKVCARERTLNRCDVVIWAMIKMPVFSDSWSAHRNRRQTISIQCRMPTKRRKRCVILRESDFKNFSSFSGEKSNSKFILNVEKTFVMDEISLKLSCQLKIATFATAKRIISTVLNARVVFTTLAKKRKIFVCFSFLSAKQREQVEKEKEKKNDDVNCTLINRVIECIHLFQPVVRWSNRFYRFTNRSIETGKQNRHWFISSASINCRV